MSMNLQLKKNKKWYVQWMSTVQEDMEFLKDFVKIAVKRAVQTQLNQESTLQVFAKTEWCTLEPELPAVLKANIVALICFARLLSI